MAYERDLQQERLIDRLRARAFQAERQVAELHKLTAWLIGLSCVLTIALVLALV